MYAYKIQNSYVLNLFLLNTLYICWCSDGCDGVLAGKPFGEAEKAEEAAAFERFAFLDASVFSEQITLALHLLFAVGGTRHEAGQT